MKALVIGASGATGKELVVALLNDDNYREVSIFVRRSTGLHHDKLTEHLVDFSDVRSYADLIVGDVLFSCIGTTLKAAGSKQEQWRVDFDIPLAFATLAQHNGVHSLVLLSSANADAKSSLFYPQMKGKLEVAVSALGFTQYICFRPGILDRPNSDRLGERVAVALIEMLNGLGLANKYRPMPTIVLAEKLSKAPYLLSDGDYVISLDHIFAL